MDKTDEYWEQVDQESIVKAIELIDGAAKELIGITSLLQGIYFAAISLSDIKKVAPCWLLLLLLVPLPFWLTSLYYATRAFVPRTYHREQDEPISELYRRIKDDKRRNLRTSYGLLMSSLLLLLVNIAIYLFSGPLSSKNP